VSRILVLYWSQTGQLLNILESITKPLEKAGHQILYKRYYPANAYPFPWTAHAFFDLMPETVLGLPEPEEVMMEPIDNPEQFDLILLGYAPWFLSPSLLVQGLFKKNESKDIFLNKPVITVTGCRNMWLNAMERLKVLLLEKNAKLVGNIALVDPAPNVVSLITLSAWLFGGKKEGFLGGVFGPSGVGSKQIQNAVSFGYIIDSHLTSGSFSGMQAKLVEAKAVVVNPNLIPIETRAIRLFHIWAEFIRKKGGPGNPNRRVRLKLYLYYILAALGIIGPIVSLFAWIGRKLNPKGNLQKISYYEGVEWKANHL
jgi:hypothetical protein